MPTYEYECRSCLYTFEEFQSITAPPLKNCPKCNGPLRRLIGGGGAIIFKGSGFYATDYRSAEYKKKAKEEAGSAEGKKKKAEKNSKSEPPSK
ncbi:MAG: zinc ribbon domain-containing protein [Nitrospirae bacterium]|nr:zinc ribbon domain-containing protein [Nitrospirota bacterium]